MLMINGYVLPYRITANLAIVPQIVDLRLENSVKKISALIGLKSRFPV